MTKSAQLENRDTKIRREKSNYVSPEGSYYERRLFPKESRMFFSLAACQNPTKSGFVTFNDPDASKFINGNAYRFLGLGADILLPVTLLVVGILGEYYGFLPNRTVQGLFGLSAVAYASVSITLFCLEKFGHITYDKQCCHSAYSFSHIRAGQ